MKKRSIKIIVSALVVSMIGGALVGCGSSDAESDKEKKIAISGSTSVGPLMEKLAAEYEESHEVSIEINQTGSSAGIKDVINGVSEIGMASRDLKDEEKSGGVKGTEIAHDGIAVIVNPVNKINALTKDQVKGIYTGKITNWKEVGGEDSPIVVVSREDGSGTRGAFEEILGYKSEELIKTAQIADGSGNIKTTVAGNKNAIGFVSFEYVDSKITAVDIDCVKATVDNVLNKTYKLSRSFLVVTKEDTISEQGKKFIDWILSEEGQKMVEQNGVIKVK